MSSSTVRMPPGYERRIESYKVVHSQQSVDMKSNFTAIASIICIPEASREFIDRITIIPYYSGEEIEKDDIDLDVCGFVDAIDTLKDWLEQNHGKIRRSIVTGVKL